MLAAGASMCRRLAVRWLSTGESAATGCPHQSGQPTKPFSAIPGPGLSIYLQMAGSDPHKPFTNWEHFHRTYGDLCAFSLAGQNFVMTMNPDHWAGIVRAAGKTPGPLQLLPWLKREADLKKENAEHVTNLIALRGQEWRDNRTVLDAVFSSIPRVQSYIPMVDSIADDMVASMERHIDGDSGQNGRLYDDLYGYSNEVIGQVVYGYRLGNLAPTRSQLADDFFALLLELFSVSSELMMSVPAYMFWKTPKYKHFLRTYARLEQLSPVLLRNSDDWHARHPDQPRHDLIAHMRDSGQSEQRILSNALIMFLAGSDSTTHTLMWLIYNLGRHPRVQEALRDEVATVLAANGGRLTSQALHDMKYLRATVKESMRLTPSASGFVRVLDTPYVLDGYEVPAGTMIMAASWNTNKSETYFAQPQEMLPERWLEEDRSKRPHPWAHLPFGSGPRICQAFRLAELEAYVLMTKLVQKYRWQTKNTVEPRLDLFIKPDRDVIVDWARL